MSHPEIGSLIRKRDEAIKMFSHRKIEQYLELLSIIAGELDPQDQDTIFIDKIDKELNWHQNTRSRKAKQSRLKQMYYEYKKWLSEINSQLWKGQYLINKRYGVILEEDDIKFE